MSPIGGDQSIIYKNLAGKNAKINPQLFAPVKTSRARMFPSQFRHQDSNSPCADPDLLMSMNSPITADRNFNASAGGNITPWDADNSR